MEKRGIVTSQLITIILLLVGFAILMLVFPILLNESEVDREVCYDSVLLRGVLPDAFNIKDIASLNCQTSYFCITDKTFGKGDCKGEEGFEKGEYETIRVSKNQNKVEEEINRFVARELASCWGMMGKGKIQIFTRDINTKKSCSICSRIAFDKELKEKINKVEGLGDYLLTREVPNQNVSYWKYLSSATLDKGLGDFSTEQKAIVFFEIGDTDIISLFGEAVGAGAGVALGIFSPVAKLKVGAIGSIGGAIMGKSVGEKIEQSVGFTYHTGWDFVDYDEKNLQGLECSSFESIS